MSASEQRRKKRSCSKEDRGNSSKGVNGSSSFRVNAGENFLQVQNGASEGMKSGGEAPIADLRRWYLEKIQIQD